MSSDELDRLRAENAALRRRIEVVSGEIEQLRAEALARRDEVRRLAADLPSIVSRRSVVMQMFRFDRRRQNTPSR